MVVVAGGAAVVVGRLVVVLIVVVLLVVGLEVVVLEVEALEVVGLVVVALTVVGLAVGAAEVPRTVAEVVTTTLVVEAVDAVDAGSTVVARPVVCDSTVDVDRLAFDVPAAEPTAVASVSDAELGGRPDAVLPWRCWSRPIAIASSSVDDSPDASAAGPIDSPASSESVGLDSIASSAAPGLSGAVLAGAGLMISLSTMATPVHATATAAALPASQRRNRPAVLSTVLLSQSGRRHRLKPILKES